MQSLYLVLGRPLDRFPVGVASRTNLVNPGTLSTHGRTNVAGNSRFGDEARYSELYEFHSCALCHEVSRRELFAKIPSLPLALGIAFFQSLSKIDDEHK